MCDLKTALLLWGLSFALPAFAGGNGGSYNGPVLNGPSIPVSVDRFARFEDMQKTMQYCLEDMAHGLWEQAYHEPISPTDPLLTVISFGPDSCGYSVSLQLVPDDRLSPPARMVTLSDDFCSPRFQAKIRLPSLPATASDPWKDSTFELADRAGLPQFHYRSEIAETAYDEFGRLQHVDQVILRDLRLQLPGLSGTAGLVNSESRHSTGLTINIDRYAQCLQSRIQR